MLPSPEYLYQTQTTWYLMLCHVLRFESVRDVMSVILNGSQKRLEKQKLIFYDHKELTAHNERVNC